MAHVSRAGVLNCGLLSGMDSSRVEVEAVVIVMMKKKMVFFYDMHLRRFL